MMKQKTYCLLVVTAILLSTGISFASNVRKAVFAGTFYPSKPEQIMTMLEGFKKKTDKSFLSHYSKKDLKALILPHAGYIYSGMTAAYGSFLLERRFFDKVIIMGPDHTQGFSGSFVSCQDAWQTPLGLIDVHKDAKKIADQYPFFQAMEKSYLKEHSIEVILPFLQFSLKKFSMVPVVVGRTNIYETSSALETFIDKNTLIVASSDLSHYLSYEEAKKRDMNTINTILKLDSQSLINQRNTACGKYPVAILLNIAKKRDWGPVLVHYSNSGDVSGNYDRVVGYCAIAFFKKNRMSEKLTKEKPE